MSAPQEENNFKVNVKVSRENKVPYLVEELGNRLWHKNEPFLG